MKNKPVKVLLIEDSPDDAQIVLFELARAAYEVESERVETAEAMRSALSRQQWDIILSDYSMPHFSGAAALEILQQADLDTPFIIVSGAIGEERAAEIMRAGAHDYVMKDNFKRLVPAIQRELREAKERDARRRAEEQVSKLSRALEQSTSLIMITDTSGMIEYVNPAFSLITGYALDEVVGLHSRVVQSGLTPPETYDHLWNTILSGRTWRGEMQNRKKSGELYWVENVISAIKDQTGTITQFLSVQEDISERKRLESELQRYTMQLEKMVEARTVELRRAKEQIELILNHTSDALALTKPNGDVEAVNPAFLATFDEQVSRSIEHILWLLTTDEQIAVVSDALLNVIYDSESRRIEAQIVSPDRTEKDIDLVLTPVRLTGDDSRNGILVSARDITHMKEIDRFKARFVADAVHDLSTPITGLSMRLHLLKHNPEKLTEHIRALENQVEHLRNLLDDLRTLSELDRGQVSLEREPVNINELVQRVFDIYEPVAINKHQSLSLALDPRMRDTQVDRRQCERVIVNLVANAVAYTPENRDIRMTTSFDGQAVAVIVADQGIGIGTEDLPHIFERFYRTSEARQAQASGSGLGLAIVREIVELHGGTVTVKSERGMGSTFTVRLPI